MLDLNFSICPICGTVHDVVRQTTTAGDQEIAWYECLMCTSILLSVGNDQWVYQKVGRNEKAHLLKRTLTTSELRALAETVEVEAVVLEPDQHVEQVGWGARVNTKWRRGAQDYPSWANDYQRNKWQQQGLLLWDHQGKRVSRLSAAQALGVLEFMHGDETWQQEGIIIGEPAVRIVIDKKQKHEPQESLTNEMALTSEQALELFELLQRYEADLQEMREAGKEDRSRRLCRVTTILFDLANKAEREGSEGGVES